MYASSQHPPVPWAYLLRSGARVCAVILFAGWAAYVAAEMFRPGFQAPIRTLAQAVALAVVFGGYAVGWRYERLGGGLTLAGVALFFAVNLLDTQVMPDLAAAFFAIPGVLYLLAWYEQRHAGPTPAPDA
jgi:hypothetical protein